MHRDRGGYWLAWMVVTGSCLALGAAVTVVVDPPGAWVLMAIMATGMACLLATAVRRGEKPAGHFVVRTTALIMLLLAGINGLAAALGSVTIVLVAVLLVSGVPLLWWARNRDETTDAAGTPPKTVLRPSRAVRPAKPMRTVAAVGAEQAPDKEPPAAPVVLPETGPLTTEKLCWAWRTSFTALRKADGIDERLRIVDLRQQCLDELARREPGGFSKWLEAGARAAGDPTRYVCIQRPKNPADDQRDG